METILTITDVTRMSGQRVCVAGANPEGKNIRLKLANGITESWLYKHGVVEVRPFAQVQFTLVEPQPTPPHTEDYLIKSDYKLVSEPKGMVQRRQFLDKILDSSVASIFGTTIQHEPGYFVAAGTGTRSLGTVRVVGYVKVSYKQQQDKSDYRIEFRDTAHSNYSLAVTDLAFRFYVDTLRLDRHLDMVTINRILNDLLKTGTVYLRIGLARGWDIYPDRCYLQITGVYNFPDYLQGKCFADYEPQNREGGRIKRGTPTKWC
jgi:hypothetical protein